MSDNESLIDMNSQYDDCQKLAQRIETLNKQFESYQAYCDYVTSNAITVQGIIPSNEEISIDLFSQDGEDESDFYSYSDSDDDSSGETDDESD